jgi:hypothetical protein
MIFSSCGIYKEKPNKKLISLLKNQHQKSGNRMKFDGVYHKVEDPSSYVDDTHLIGKPILFFENGLMTYDFKTNLDSVWYIKFMTSNYSYNANWGVYEILGDTIRSTIYCTLMGNAFHRTQLLQCNFEGVIKNQDTILGWRMITPYPKKLNEHEFRMLTTPRDLYFKSVPIKQLINPEMAWINEFKNENSKSKRRSKK